MAKKLDTEYKVYKYIQNNNNLPCLNLAYPWTTIIDLFNHKIKNYNTLYDFVVDLGLTDNLKKEKIILQLFNHIITTNL